jgi:hypothetical protein
VKESFLFIYFFCLLICANSPRKRETKQAKTRFVYASLSDKRIDLIRNCFNAASEKKN